MPYHVVKDGDKWCVEKQDGSKRFGCHDSKQKANDQMAALYAQEPKASIRHLRLVGATGEIRTAQYDGREHLVVPVVAMVEGVVWAINSEVPEFVPAEELAETPHQWNGRGCFAGHPKDDGRQVTANTPRTLEKSFGVVFDTSSSERILKTRRLELHAWLDPAKARIVSAEAIDVIKRLRAGERVEVSVGCYVEAEQRDGTYNGQEYHSVWHNIVSDHLAFLEKGQEGACSIEAGCGAPRTAIRHLVTAQGIKREAIMSKLAASVLTQAAARLKHAQEGWKGGLRDAKFFISQGQSDQEVRRAIDAALRAIEPGYLGIDSVYPDDGEVIYYVAPEDELKMMRRSYSMADGKATLNGSSEEVEPVTTYEPKAAAAPVKIPAPKAASCGCKGDAKMTRAELIATLVTDKFSGFKDGDEPFLETASDARLEEFRSAADANKLAASQITRLETDNRNLSARLKVSDERLRVAESPMTEEDFVLRAPAPIKAILDARKAEEDALRASLVSQLKDLGAHTEEQLKTKSVSELQTLAAYARIEVPDFSGRGTPRLNSKQESNDDYIPPDPYAAGVKILQARTAASKVN